MVVGGQLLGFGCFSIWGGMFCSNRTFRTIYLLCSLLRGPWEPGMSSDCHQIKRQTISGAILLSGQNTCSLLKYARVPDLHPHPHPLGHLSMFCFDGGKEEQGLLISSFLRALCISRNCCKLSLDFRFEAQSSYWWHNRVGRALIYAVFVSVYKNLGWLS